MNAEEKRIAREIKLGFRKCVRNAPHWHEAQLGKIEHVQVKLNADGSYAYVSGPELHTLKGRKRLVWAIRWGCSEIAPDGHPRVSAHPHIAYGGFSWRVDRAEAIAKLAEVQS